MNLLLTSASSELAQALADGLSDGHSLRLTDRTWVSTPYEFALSPLGHDASTNLLVRGMDAIIHLVEPLPDDSDTSYLDFAMRGTYNLLTAAAEEGVKRAIYLGSLDVMAGYDPDYLVTERWRPVPTPAPRVLGRHLAEYVCREFAREHRLQVAVLRIGHPVRAEEVADAPFDPLWVDVADVVQAVSLALDASLDLWTVLHIQADGPHSRFPIDEARRVLGFSPRVQFEPVS
ncbi:MAG: hypothetical protein KatS3mg050_4574 [Litorilinea sp.]|nr:MAG: hypothetical protein KatS3mg050_4574 [Litorilinea sp.]